ncbi:unnamed protein product [Paramecium pentaurelia]|uniref:Ankyrin repeat-containing protein n=1 Tax=Paramecium pentaurelia TaxID=43138 RepID=A0A8S1V489_9CILI|nr:unnamed protein product [Paramecium pentaurelia]
MNWDFINRKLKEFFEQRRQQSIDKIFTLNTVTDLNIPKKQFLEMETQVTDDPKFTQMQQTIPLTLSTPKKTKSNPKSFSQISHLFSPHGPARSTASMQMRQIVASTLKNESNSYNSVRTKDIKKVQELVGQSSKTANKPNFRKLRKQQTVVSQKILKEFDNQFDQEPNFNIKQSDSLKCFITQTKNINTLAMRAQLKMKSYGSIRQLNQPSPTIDNFTKMNFAKSSDPRVGLDRFLSNKWLQFVIEQKSMRKDDQFNDYLKSYTESPQKLLNVQKLKQKQEVRQQFNNELPLQHFKPHRHTPLSAKNKQIKKETQGLVKSYSQTVFDIEKRKDDEELIEFYPIYYDKKVKRRRIIRKLKVLAKIAVIKQMFVYQLLEQQQQLIPYQSPGSVAFLRFVKYNNIHAAKQMLDQEKKLIGSFDELGQYAIHLAVMIQSIDMVKLLLCYGADVNSNDFFLQKPLYFALVTNNLAIAKLLLACRATPWDQHLRDYFGCCRSQEAKDLIKLAQYLKIYNRDPECLLNIENIKQHLSLY